LSFLCQLLTSSPLHDCSCPFTYNLTYNTAHEMHLVPICSLQTTIFLFKHPHPAMTQNIDTEMKNTSTPHSPSRSPQTTRLIASLATNTTNAQRKLFLLNYLLPIAEYLLFPTYDFTIHQIPFPLYRRCFYHHVIKPKLVPLLSPLKKNCQRTSGGRSGSGK